MAHRRPRSFQRGPRRKTDWIGWPDAQFTAIAGNTNVLLSSVTFTQPETIVRTRGLISITGQAGSADLNIVGALGCTIVSDQAFAAGAASIPGPWTDSDYDGWFVLQPFVLKLDVTTDIGRLIFDKDYMIDSKAQRKVTDGETVVTMVESQGAAFSIADPFRYLTMLP